MFQSAWAGSAVWLTMDSPSWEICLRYGVSQKTEVHWSNNCVILNGDFFCNQVVFQISFTIKGKSKLFNVRQKHKLFIIHVCIMYILKAMPHVVHVLGDGTKALITLSCKAQVLRLVIESQLFLIIIVYQTGHSSLWGGCSCAFLKWWFTI